MAFEVAAVYSMRKKYKPVDKKIVPVKTTLPDEYRIIRRAHPNPLGDMPTLPTSPPGESTSLSSTNNTTPTPMAFFGLMKSNSSTIWFRFKKTHLLGLN
jgi:hypothetical protein